MDDPVPKVEKGNESIDYSDSLPSTSSQVRSKLQPKSLSSLGNSDNAVQSESREANPSPPIDATDREQTKNNDHKNSERQESLPQNLDKTSEEKAEIGIAKSLEKLCFDPSAGGIRKLDRKSGKEDLYDLLKKMIDANIKPNIHISIGNVLFKCHSEVLQCYSKYFLECCHEGTVQLPEERITPKGFTMVYDWMRASDPLVQLDGVLELFNAATFLKVDELVEQCWALLNDHQCIQEDTAFFLYLKADIYGLETVRQVLIARVCKFFLTLVCSSDFVLLNATDVCRLLSLNSIGVNSEVEILMSALRWLFHDWDTRKTNMTEVFRCVRFALIPPWVLTDLGRDCHVLEVAFEDPMVKNMMEDVLSCTASKQLNADKLGDCVALHKLNVPVSRQWVYDQDCSYHHDPKCPNNHDITYESFLTYLKLLRTKGVDHWKTLKTEYQEGALCACCAPEADQNCES